MLRGLVGLALCCPGLLLAADTETKLDAAATEKTLAAISETFAKTPCLRAKVVSQREESLTGEKLPKENGELILQRPDKMPVRYEGAAGNYKARQLLGTLYREYSPNTKKCDVRDFAKAARKLALLRAAMTGDVAVLKEYFNIEVFRTSENGKPARLRLVLTPLADAPIKADYKSIEARLAEGQAFFDFIRYVPKAGDPGEDTYSEIKAAEGLTEKDFADALIDKAPKQVTRVSDEEKK